MSETAIVSSVVISILVVIALIVISIFSYKKNKDSKEKQPEFSSKHLSDPNEEDVEQYMKEAQAPFLQIVSHSFITMEKCGLEADDSKDIFCFFSAWFYCMYYRFIFSPNCKISADNMLQAITCWFYTQKDETFMQTYSDYTKSIMSRISHINKYDHLATMYAYAVVASEHLFNYGFSFNFNEIISSIKQYIKDSGSPVISIITEENDSSQEADQIKEILNIVISKMGVNQKVKEKINNDYIEPYLT